MTRPSPPELIAETARLAYHLHWPLETILDLEHRDRRAFLAEADELAGFAVVSEEAPSAPAPAAAPAPPVPRVDLDSIEDPKVRALFATYGGGA